VKNAALSAAVEPEITGPT